MYIQRGDPYEQEQRIECPASPAHRPALGFCERTYVRIPECVPSFSYGSEQIISEPRKGGGTVVGPRRHTSTSVELQPLVRNAPGSIPQAFEKWLVVVGGLQSPYEQNGFSA